MGVAGDNRGRSWRAFALNNQPTTPKPPQTNDAHPKSTPPCNTRSYGVRIGAFFAPLVRVLMWATLPVTWPLGWVLDRTLGHDDSLFKRRELAAMVTLHQEGGGMGGTLSADEVNVISGALEMTAKVGVCARGGGGDDGLGVWGVCWSRGRLFFVGGRVALVLARAPRLTPLSFTHTHTTNAHNKHTHTHTHTNTQKCTPLFLSLPKTLTPTAAATTHPTNHHTNATHTHNPKKAAGAGMTPIDHVFMLSTDDIIDEKMVDRILRQGHSRLPVDRCVCVGMGGVCVGGVCGWVF